MANIVFVNPSANIYRLASELTRKGSEVVFVKNREIPTITPENVLYFYDNKYALFNEEWQDISERDERVNLFKSGFFARLKMLTVSHNLSSLNSSLSCGTFSDLVTFKSKTIIKPETDAPESTAYDTLTEIRATYSSYKIFASTVKDIGSATLTAYNTDFDFKSAFGNDYYVLLLHGNRTELFAYKNSLVVISKIKKPIESLKKTFPTLSKYSFEVDKAFTIFKNHSPYINYEFQTKATLLNDYSFGRSSVNMSEDFFEKLASHILLPKP